MADPCLHLIFVNLVFAGLAYADQEPGTFDTTKNNLDLGPNEVTQEQIKTLPFASKYDQAAPGNAQNALFRRMYLEEKRSVRHCMKQESGQQFIISNHVLLLFTSVLQTFPALKQMGR